MEQSGAPRTHLPLPSQHLYRRGVYSEIAVGASVGAREEKEGAGLLDSVDVDLEGCGFRV
jgi:hypothetical protein